MTKERVLEVLYFYERVFNRLVPIATATVPRISESERVDFPSASPPEILRWRVILYLHRMIFETRILIRKRDTEKEVSRWLGFMQGALWVIGVFSIDEMRDHNCQDVPIPKEYDGKVL